MALTVQLLLEGVENVDLVGEVERIGGLTNAI